MKVFLGYLDTTLNVGYRRDMVTRYPPIPSMGIEPRQAAALPQSACRGFLFSRRQGKWLKD